MPRKYSIDYIERLLVGKSYDDLVQLSSAICSSSGFTVEEADYGLPRFAFLFVETLRWFAQASRCGVWTYYEASPQVRLDAMLVALRVSAPEGFAEWYERGMRDWRDQNEVAAVDDWMEANGKAACGWLRDLAAINRESVLTLTS